MSRNRYSSRHLIKETNVLSPYEGSVTPRTEYVAYCGEKDTTRVVKFTSDPMHTSCSVCAKHAGKLKVAEIVGDLKIEPWEEGKNKAWRSANYAVLNGEPIAHILFDTGYGGKWKIRSLTVDMSDGEVLVGQTPDAHSEPYTVEVDGVEKTINRTFGATASSKEMALYLAYRLFIAGKLRSLTQAREDATAEKQRIADSNRRWRESEAQAAQEKAELIEALEGIRAKAEAKEIDLTNFEVDSLMKAIAIVREART